MKSLLSALQFLTIIPVKIKHVQEKQIARALIYFPIIGLFLGLILLVFERMLYILNFGQFSINTILVVLLIILTGGIHLDGLSDTVDALSSRKNKEEMLKIMRDSHIGVMGVLSLISIILLKISFLSSLNTVLRPTALLIMCILSRWSMVLAIFSFAYAREEGKAKVFFQGINLKIFLLSTLITMGCVMFIWKLKGLAILGIILLSTYLIAKSLKNKIGGLSGDTLGAINELNEVIILCVMTITAKIFLWII